MKITDAFLGEHAVFYAQFNYIENTSHEWDTNAIKIASAQLAAALASHASLEDDLLFKALEPTLGTGMGPLAVMRAEHKDIDGTLAQIPDVSDTDKVQEMILHVITVARQHFAKEEQILYPIAIQHIGTQRLEELGADWARQRNVMVIV